MYYVYLKDTKGKRERKKRSEVENGKIVHSCHSYARSSAPHLGFHPEFFL